MATDPKAQRAARLLVKEIFAGVPGHSRAARKRNRDAIRGVTLLDAPPTPLKFSMDDYRDVTRFDCQAALRWLGTQAPAAPSARRQAAVEAMLAVLQQNDAKRKRPSSSEVLRTTVLEGWPTVELTRVVGLLFEVGLFRHPAQPDGPLWYYGRRRDLRFHTPTALRLFPKISLGAEDAAKVRIGPPKAVPPRRTRTDRG